MVSDLMPWNKHPFIGWSIIGMNHYHVDGVRFLFVAMERHGDCVKAEGKCEDAVFFDLGNKITARHKGDAQ